LNLSRHRHGLFASACLAIAACPDDEGSNQRALVEDRVSAAYCKHLRSCAQADFSESLVLTIARQAPAAECQRLIKRVLVGRGGLDAGIEAGVLVADEDRVAACIEAVTTSCNPLPSPACSDIVEGEVALGAACDSDAACAGDAYCAGADSGCPGVCTARQPRGGACDEAAACSQAEGPSDCSYESETCVAIVYAVADEDAPCGEDITADRVTVTACADGLACSEGGEPGEMSCQRPIEDGGACSSDMSACELGSVCLPDGGERTCQKLTVAQAGEACNETDLAAGSFVPCDVAKGLGCIAGRCEAAGDGSVGARCFGGQGLAGQCDVGNYCERASNTCQALLADGADCAQPDACQSGYCEPEVGECQSACALQ